MAEDLWFNPSSSATSSYIPINVNRYEIESSMTQLHQSVGMTNEDPYLLSKLDILNQKLDQFLSGGQSQVSYFTYPTPQEMYPPYYSAAHCVSDCPLVAQYPVFIQGQVQVAQDFPSPINDPFSNTYNPS